ncbi:hypothetical protein [Synechococcus sp. EJ6-Ellesmere]|uniref:hypothetical protein n=1 Tax=Synechococcus sp. EJ6-Ellesmere TaxID=2823734 RepID=UPI0020CF9B35|nr:hypothetical protein [Synechococcus sp. EJ6-Ellesmere]MCP9824251.1 hypothetical protein [Synechococcus sp. EJ6-Ellesmere]
MVLPIAAVQLSKGSILLDPLLPTLRSPLGGLGAILPGTVLFCGLGALPVIWPASVRCFRPN